MTPELSVALDMLGSAAALIRASVEQDAAREPVALTLEEIPESDDGPEFACVHVSESCGPMLVYAIKYWSNHRNEWSLHVTYALRCADTTIGVSSYPEMPALYPLSDWPQLVRMWLAKRGTT